MFLQTSMPVKTILKTIYGCYFEDKAEDSLLIDRFPSSCRQFTCGNTSVDDEDSGFFNSSVITDEGKYVAL